MLVDESYMIHVATDPRIWAYNKGLTGVVYDQSGNVMFAGAQLKK
jgi:hypothetical protein